MVNANTNTSFITDSDTILSLDTATGSIRYGLTNDYMFRAVFQKSEEALRHLLSALLWIPYESIVSCDIQNPILLGDTIDEKTCILDIRLLLNNNRLINLEMQTGKFECWPNRMLFYLSRLYCNIQKGQDYSAIKPAIHIGILTESPFPDIHEFYSEYLMINTSSGHILSRNFSSRMLSLDQLDHASAKERESELYYWAKLFKASTWEDIQMLSKDKPYLNAAVSNLRILTEDEKIQLQCEARERYILDMNSARNEGERKGEQKGLERFSALVQKLLSEGRNEEIARVAADSDYRNQLLEQYQL